jgi:hypothetical protein
VKSWRKLSAFILALSFISPAPAVFADDPNPSNSEIDNYASLTTTGNPKQGFALVGSTLLNSSTGSFSVEAWVNPSDAMSSLNSTVFLKQDSVAFRINSLKLEVSLNNGSWATYASNSYLRTNEWQHVAMVKSSTTLYLYINGVLVYQNASVHSSISSNTKYIGIGGDGWNGSSTLSSPQSAFLSGGIDEVRVWSGARTASEIDSNKDRKLSGTTSNLLAYWDMNGSGSASLIHDRSANGHNLSIYGSPSFPDVKTTSTSSGYTTVTFPRTYLNSTSGFLIPSGVTSVSALIVGGGGGGGFDGGGGGGGGGLYQNTDVAVTPGATYYVEVGGGGPAINGYVGGTFCTGGWNSTAVGCLSGSGTTSSFGVITASGGGGGGGIESNGGSDSDPTATVRGGGGGAGSQNSKVGATSGGAGAFSGGASSDVAGNAGGGGASSLSAGSSTTSTLAGGGASGATSTIDSLVYGSGGGGGSYNNATAVSGGSGAGTGGTNSLSAVKPVANRGGGGGGGGTGGGTASSGAAGIVIIKYALKGFSTISFGSAPVFKTATTITAAVNTASKVTFLANGKRIPGCIKVSTSNLSASCTWKPALHGYFVITVQVVPTDANYASATAQSTRVLATKRIGLR